LLPTVSPSVASPEPGAAMELDDTVTPLGMPVTFTEIAESNVVVRVVVATVLPLEPCPTVRLVGFKVSEKLGAGKTFTVR